MTDFNPGPGWVQAAAESPGVEEGRDVLMRIQHGVTTYWVREEPVPPLPTETYTVIKAMFGETWGVFVLYATGWQGKNGGPLDEARLTGFKVLAEPPFAGQTAKQWALTEAHTHDLLEAEQEKVDAVRRETAKAVLDHVRRRNDAIELDDIAREFGVES